MRMEVDIPQEVVEIARQEEESAQAAELFEEQLEKETAKGKDDSEVMTLDVEVHRQKDDDDEDDTE